MIHYRYAHLKDVLYASDHETVKTKSNENVTLIAAFPEAYHECLRLDLPSLRKRTGLSCHWPRRWIGTACTAVLAGRHLNLLPVPGR